MNGSLPYKEELSESELRYTYCLYQKKNITFRMQKYRKNSFNNKFKINVFLEE